MNKIKILIKNKLLIAIIMGIFSYLTLYKNLGIATYNFYSWLIFGFLIIIFYKYCFINYNKRIKKELGIIALILSFILLLGNIIWNIKGLVNTNFIKELFQLKNIIYLIGNFNLIFILLQIVIPKLLNIKSIQILKDKVDKNKGLQIFALTFIILFLVYGIYYLAFFPGLLSGDSFSEVRLALDNLKVLSDQHTLIHLLFFAGPFKLGMLLFNNVNLAVSVPAFIQMILLALIFSYFIYFMYQRKIKNWILGICIAYFTILPMHGYYSITIWKDVMFAGCFLLLIIETIKMVEKDKITLKNSWCFIVFSLLTIFFRNNAVYAYLILVIFSFIIFRKYYKQLIFIFVIILGTYGIIKYPLYNYLNVKKSASVEYLAMPLQQVGRMAHKNVQFTNNEIEFLNKIMPIDIWKNAYYPESVDGIKFNDNFNNDFFNSHKIQYIKVWGKLVLKHPVTAVESYLASTLGYWYPSNEHWSVMESIGNNELGLYTNSKLPKVKELLVKVSNHSFPIINMTWSIGLCFWFVALLVYITKKRLGWKYIYPYILVVGIWLTMMIASPVYGEFRYVYCIFVSLPLLAIYPFMKDNDNLHHKR